MSRRLANFLEADVRRALSAAQKAGPQWRVEIMPGGLIRLVQGEASTGETNRSRGVPLAEARDWRL
jgi:hypothetical protein